ncbi:YlxR family protein [Alkalicella caledoniensis]|uniref:YlxR family protein n=1 Tax=Alkalicella caledoniensis TaxID=2731377 RepID=A0A7G9WCQ1_ALKCA|nr:YlxR family protein [Alkalicella caledoniensis]QNO16463.1 YlxR family protein [Alkalicella caledoniensis]
MKERKIPERMCVGCQQMKLKKELIRVVKPKEGDIALDPTGKLAGRGAYLCNDIDCFKTAYKSKRLERSLKTQIPVGIYEQIQSRFTD